MHGCHSVAVVEYLIGTFQALAETLDATLVTGDRRLGRAAPTPITVEVVPPAAT
jgi:hypothetical protein